MEHLGPLFSFFFSVYHPQVRMLTFLAHILICLSLPSLQTSSSLLESFPVSERMDGFCVSYIKITLCFMLIKFCIAECPAWLSILSTTRDLRMNS